MEAKRGSNRRGGGGKLARSETVTVRLDPKLRYLAELAARKQRRTLSSFIEWAIEDSLSRVTLDRNRTVEQEAAKLWDVDDVERFVRLGVHHPDLLTFEEQQLWKALNASELLSPAYHPEVGWDFESLGAQVLPKVQDHWSELMKARTSFSDLREWVNRTRSEVHSGKIYPKPAEEQVNVSQGAFDRELDDEIPF